MTMESLKIKCPNCTGTTEVARWKNQGICQYCNAVLDTGRSTAFSNPNGVTEEDKNGETPENTSVFEALARVDAQYFDKVKTFDEILATYAELDTRGAHGYEFWLSRARFFAAASISEFEEGRMASSICQDIIAQYVIWMDKAISDYVGNGTPLKMEKEKTIGDIRNTFEGHKRREENEAREKAALLEQQRQLDAMDDADMATLEMEELSKRNTKRNIIIIAAIAIVLLILAFFIRSCGSTEERDIEAYEEFLHLAYILEFFENDATRADIFELNLDFGNEDTHGRTIRVIAPEEAALNRISFRSEDDDLITRIRIEDAQTFNEFDPNDGIDSAIFAGFDVDIIEATDIAIHAILDDLQINIQLETPTSNTNTFSIDVTRIDLESELTATQQARWNQIEARIEAGYTSWGDLVIWAYGQDITFAFFENEARPIEAIGSLISEYGLLGDYQEATPWLGSLSDPEEVILVLHFENLTYNEDIAELFSLNRNSNRELNAWLETGGGGRLDHHFDTVEIINLDEEGEIITEMTEAVEFIEWEIMHIDLFQPVGTGRIRIERTFRHLEIETEPETEPDTATEPETEAPTVAPTEPPGPPTLASGSWTVGTDVPQGRFTISGDSPGTLVVWRGNTIMVSETLGGGADGISSVTTYLLTGDLIVITGINNVTFTPAPDRILSTTLGAGNWVVGTDIPAGEFNARTNGSGRLIVWRGDEVIVDATLENGLLSGGEDRVLVNLVVGDIITISGLDQVIFE